MHCAYSVLRIVGKISRKIAATLELFIFALLMCIKRWSLSSWSIIALTLAIQTFDYLDLEVCIVNALQLSSGRGFLYQGLNRPPTEKLAVLSNKRCQTAKWLLTCDKEQLQISCDEYILQHYCFIFMQLCANNLNVHLSAFV